MFGMSPLIIRGEGLCCFGRLILILMLCSVPISQLPRFVRETTIDFEERGIVACHLGSVPPTFFSALTHQIQTKADSGRHVGDGNVHSLALFTNDEELAIVRKAVHEMVDRAIRLDGTCSGEHGVGLGKIEYLESELGVGTVGLMETIKRTRELSYPLVFSCRGLK